MTDHEVSIWLVCYFSLVLISLVMFIWWLGLEAIQCYPPPQERGKLMLTKLAVQWLTWRLRKDKGFWISYQANIAMQIYDNYNKYFPLTTEKASPTLLEWCNICANDFLILWTGKKQEDADNGK